MRIGIITIHRLTNFGTALQAFALQRYLQKNTNCHVEIIDYVFPNAFHKNKKTIIKRIRGWARLFLDYLFEKNIELIKDLKIFRIYILIYLKIHIQTYNR